MANPLKHLYFHHFCTRRIALLMSQNGENVGHGYVLLRWEGLSKFHRNFELEFI